MTETKRRVVGKPFQKGKSGNPSGRPKELEDVKELARAHTLAAINRLVEWMQSTNAKASVAACGALLDRAWGKPSQAVTMSNPDGTPLKFTLSLGDANRD